MYMKTVKDLVVDYITKCTISSEQVASLFGISTAALPKFELRKALVPVTRHTRYDIDDINQLIADRNYDREMQLQRHKSIADNEQPKLLTELTNLPDEIKIAKLSAYVAILEAYVQELENALAKERSENERLRNHL